MNERKKLLIRIVKNKFVIIGSSIVLLIIILALISPKIIVYDPEFPDLANRLSAPDYFKNGWSGHILGTDTMGQDIWTRILIGSRVSLAVAASAVFGAALIGTFAGLLAGFYGGWVDNILMRLGDMQSAIPMLLLAISIVAVLGTNLVNLVLVLIITSWVQYARVIRASVMTIRGEDYVLANRAMGASGFRIMFRAILPNVATPLFILISQQLGQMILLEASMSFLGLGVQPPTPSWGTMIAGARAYIAMAPWAVMAPGIALMITVLGFNFLGDGIRDVLDPKMKR